MQLIKGIFVAAMLCVASVSANDSQPQEPKKPTEKGFNVSKVSFASSDPTEEKGEEKEDFNYIPIAGAVGACVCVGILGAVYWKRRKANSKLQGDIFTIDDKNSVL